MSTRAVPQNLDMVAKAVPPDYALGSHVAALGLTFSSGTLLPEPFRNGVFVGEHGSWNRKPASGYKVVFVPFANGRPSGRPMDVLNGFLDANGDARGRPVGVAIAKDGALLVADDVGNTVWRIVPSGQTIGQSGRN
jgi:glucose/arabinose dehydrogenase